MPGRKKDAASSIPARRTLRSVRLAALDCRACDLWKHATQTVFGEGPKRAELMLAEMKRPELEDVALKNRTTTAKLIWQPRGYDPHLHKWLHRIDVPTLLVWGDSDRLFPKDYAFAYQGLIPGSKVAIIPNCVRKVQELPFE